MDRIISDPIISYGYTVFHEYSSTIFCIIEPIIALELKNQLINWQILIGPLAPYLCIQ